MKKIKTIFFLTPLLVSFSNGSQLNFLPSLNSKLEDFEIYKIVYSERKTEKLLTNNNSEFASAEINLDVIRTSCSGPYSNKKESITLFYRTLFHLNASCTYKNGMFWWFTSDQPFTNIKEVNISTTLDRYNKSEFICGPNELLTKKKQNDVYYVTMGDSELYENISFNGIEFDGHKDKTINGISYTYPYYIKYYDKTYKDYIFNTFFTVFNLVAVLSCTNHIEFIRNDVNDMNYKLYYSSKDLSISLTDFETNNKELLSTLIVKKYGEINYKDNSQQNVKIDLLGTNFTKEASLKKVVDKYIVEYENDFSSNKFDNIFKLTSETFKISNKWKLCKKDMKILCLDYGDVHFGDYQENNAIYTCENDKYKHFLIKNNSLIRPNIIDTDDFRANKLIYNLKMTEKSEILDVCPSYRGENITINYFSDLSYDFNLDSYEKCDISFSGEYEAIRNSPFIQVHEQNRDVSVMFDYLNPWAERNPFYKYNIGETKQHMMYVFKKGVKEKELKILENHYIDMVCDDFFPRNNKEVRFQLTNILNC